MQLTAASKRTFWICGLLAALTVAAFWPVVLNGFVSFDDTAYVTENPRVLAGLSWANIKWAFGTGYFGNWHPATWISHMLDVQCFGLNPGYHHLVSLLLHTGTVVLVFLTLRRMTGDEVTSAFAAALFGVHPLRVESVAWLSERKDVLSLFFGLISLWAYARYVDAQERPATIPQSSCLGASNIPHQDSPAPSNRLLSEWKNHPSLYYAIALLAFSLALMSKAMLVTLPCVMLLLDFWPLRRFERETVPFHRRVVALVIEKLPFFMLSAASTILGFVMLKISGSIAHVAGAGPWQRLAFTAHGYFGYLSKSIWPVNLSLPYVRPSHVATAEVVAALGLLAGISLVSLLWLKRRPYFAVGWFWFIGALLPVSGVFQLGVQSMADRYTYFPSIGFFLALTWGFSELARDWKAGPAAVGACGGLLLAAFVLLSNRQLGFWRNSEQLYRHAVEVDNNNFVGHNGLGFEFFKQGKVDEAIAEGKAALRNNSSYDPAYSNLGRFFAEKKNYQAAITNLETALRLNPRDVKTHNNLGNVLLLQGRNQEAFDQFNQVIRLNPDHAEGRNNLALACQKMGRNDEAIIHYREAIQLKPDFLTALNNLAWLLATSPNAQFRDGTEAMQRATRACELTGYSSPAALATLAAACAESGQFQSALSLTERAQASAGTGRTELATRLEKMTDAFRSARPYREELTGIR